MGRCQSLSGGGKVCRRETVRGTINLSHGSTIFLPDKRNAHDDHDNAVDYRGDDWRGPDVGLVGLGGHRVAF